MGLYKEVKEGEKANPFSVHKWVIKTRKVNKQEMKRRRQQEFRRL